MRIHVSKDVTHNTIREAMTAAGVYGDVSEHGSRSHDHAFNVTLFGASNRRPNFGKSGANSNDYAATWDQWGIFLAAIFAADPNAKCWAYANAYDFHWQTGERFTSEPEENVFIPVIPTDMHGDHKFDYVGQLLGGRTSLHRCRKCTATKRYNHSS